MYIHNYSALLDPSMCEFKEVHIETSKGNMFQLRQVLSKHLRSLQPVRDCIFQHFTQWLYWLLPFKQAAMEFFLLFSSDGSAVLAVIPGHLFVLVCAESPKRVACPNWECLPFKHLYEPDDPALPGRLFIGFPSFLPFRQI